MTLDYGGIVAAVTVAIYALSILFVPFFLSRPSFGVTTAWVFLATFCILRIIGSSMQLSLETWDPFDKHLATGAAICSAIGLGPLLLITSALLRQCNAFLHISAVPNQTHRALITFDFCTIVATAVGIAGGVTSFKRFNTSGEWNPTSTFQAGVCLYLAAYVCILGAATVIAARTTSYRDSIQHETNRLKMIVASLLIILMLLAVRVIYSMLLAFDNSPSISPFGGSESIRFFMQSLMEYLVTVIILAIGVSTRNTAPPPPRKEESNTSEARKMMRYVPFLHWFIR